jgi:hypothetical protein
MSLQKELHKARLMGKGLPAWQAEMVAAEADLGGMRGVISDARTFANVHNCRGILPEDEPTARERAAVEARAKAQREKEAEWERLSAQKREAEAEWRSRR